MREPRAPSWVRLVAPGALVFAAVAVLGSALTAPPYFLVLASLFAVGALLAAASWLQGSDVDPFAGPLAFKLAILAVTILYQPSLVGRDPHFELAVTQRLIEQGSWDPGLGFASQKARGYAHYPGLSLLAGTLSILSGVEPASLARFVPPLLATLGLVLLVAIARDVTGDDRLALAAGIAWAAFSLANVFQAEYVHEALGFPLFLAGVLLLFRHAYTGDPAPLAGFVIVSMALVVTHHLSTAFLLGFGLLFALAHVSLGKLGNGAGKRRALVPVGLFVGLAVTYQFVFGDPAVLGYMESTWDTLAGGASHTSPTPAQPPDPSHPVQPADPGGGTPNPDPNVQKAVFYERRGRDELIFNARIVLLVALLGLSVANLAWRGLHGSLDAGRISLFAWSSVIVGLGAASYLANVTVGVDAPRLLPWAFVFLVVTAADVPTREDLHPSLRRRARRLHERLGDLVEAVPFPSPRKATATVLALLVVFAGFQLVTLPPHLVSEEREPAYYRSQVRQYYHEDERAMSVWVQEEVDDGNLILGDMTAYELVGPTDHGELTITTPFVYSGDSPPPEDAYVVWRDEMGQLYLGLDQDLEPIFFPVPDEQRRTFANTTDYARLYETQRTGVYAYEK